MGAPSAADLLTAWEYGAGESRSRRILGLLRLARPEVPPDELAQISLGERDRSLLALRESTFGPDLASVTTCPKCTTQLEFTLQAGQICVPALAESAATSSVRLDGYEVEFRLPTTGDLAALDEEDDLSRIRQGLLEHCILNVNGPHQERAVERLPDNVLAEVEDRMGQMDPQTSVRIAVTCPTCDHSWEASFDIASFFWTEVSAWAQRLLYEVHTLASAYGWSEADILSMSRQRRRIYIEMANR
jgi:hypothetical protein